jgi:hypothetical protein
LPFGTVLHPEREGAIDPRVEGVIGRLEGHHQHCAAIERHPVDHRLRGVEQPAVRGLQT